MCAYILEYTSISCDHTSPIQFRIIVQHIPSFKDQAKHVDWHISSKHSLEMAKMSKVVSCKVYSISNICIHSVIKLTVCISSFISIKNILEWFRLHDRNIVCETC